MTTYKLAANHAEQHDSIGWRQDRRFGRLSGSERTTDTDLPPRPPAHSALQTGAHLLVRSSYATMLSEHDYQCVTSGHAESDNFPNASSPDIV